ncbi:D-alanyl-lipoteichoic acid biosynthesis protein DltD [Fluviicola sp.]|uniref:D-alanyl-lipoteichoic acid biosynthesis protein DltD n=1 Tax=Fluviicola sp. TaxID=1917219 RepID=UPI0031D25E29
MKKILPGLFKYHLIPIAISLGVLYLLNFLLATYYRPAQKPEHIVVSGTAGYERGIIADFYNKQTEIELIGSLSDKQKLTIFGSSELALGEAYSSYYFMPDSIGIPTIAFGHAYHQNLSIACELLAAGDNLNGANVCIILSPGWFETEGTNIEAFLEFVRPDFLRRIIHDPSIPLSNKLRVADFVRDFYSDINNPSVELTYLKNMSLYGRYSWMPGKFNELPLNIIPHVDYQVVSAPKKLEKAKRTVDWASAKKRTEQDFLKTCRNNSSYIDSAYYVDNLLKNGTYRRGKVEPDKSDREFEDFQLVVEILKRHHCKATFVLQPLNPYHFDYMYRFTPIQKRIRQELSRAHFPLLDMYRTDKSRYVPGTLKDIMHPGNRGWIEVSEFLVKRYRHLYE